MLANGNQKLKPDTETLPKNKAVSQITGSVKEKH
jgi:hypothetical protein